MTPCNCTREHGPPPRIVLTGGPGGGKTAVLELVRKQLCEHLIVLPEAATIVFAGGFPRSSTMVGRSAAQRAIFRVQSELEAIGLDADGPSAAVVLCDRGTVDGVAYWPGDPEAFWKEMGTTRGHEMARYWKVVHLRTPPPETYNHQNRVRIETAIEAAAIDAKIAAAWEGHPRRYFVESHHEFMTKAKIAVDLITAELPECCRVGLSAARGAGARG